jgi:hypothetical protein
MNSGLEVFFTEVNSPWSNADPGIYHVNVYSPDGVEIVGHPAPNGYASIDLPPGRYLVTGTLTGVYVNFDSNETLVNVGCGQRACVTVIPRSLHFCIWWLNAALQVIAEQPNFAPEVAEQAKALIEPLRRMERSVPAKFRMLPQLQRGIDIVRSGRVFEPVKEATATTAAKTTATAVKKGGARKGRK